MNQTKTRVYEAKHKALIDLCSPIFIASALAEFSEIQPKIVRCIVLGNIKRGRVTGLMSREPAGHQNFDRNQWMMEYAQKVARCLQTEKKRWQAFVEGSGDNELVEILWRFVCQHVPGLEQRSEVWGQAYVLVKERLNNGFSFDEPLDCWLEKLTRSIAIELGRSRRFAERELQVKREREEIETDGEPFYQSSGECFNPTGEWDRCIDVAMGLRRMKSKPREIFLRRVYGQDAKEISRVMKIPIRTVQNNLTKITKELDVKEMR